MQPGWADQYLNANCGLRAEIYFADVTGRQDGQGYNAAMTDTPVSRRAMCAACLRPVSACLCKWVQPVACRVEVLLLQHPLEVANAKGTARLLHLCLPGSVLAVGEQFDAAQLEVLLRGGGRTPVLLYPETPDGQSLGLPSPPPFDAALLQAPGRLRLVVLDGTWRKSRKMLYLNRALQALPRLPLAALPPGRYTIRKAHAPEQLSTLEATACALGQMEGDAQKFAPLLRAFDGFVSEAAARFT
jgi:DTW domain-containing protein YfiP